MRILIIFIALSLLSACLNEGKYDSKSRFKSEELQNKLLVELDKAEIPYKVDDHGYIKVQDKHKTIIDALATLLLLNIEDSREKPELTRVEFPSFVNSDIFFSYLHLKNVDTENVVYHVDSHSVSWPKERGAELYDHFISFIEEHREKMENEFNKSLKP